jgi:hypothetical protein
MLTSFRETLWKVNGSRWHCSADLIVGSSAASSFVGNCHPRSIWQALGRAIRQSPG